MPDSILAPVAALSVPDQAALSNRAQQALAFVQDFQVVDAETFGMAADELQGVKRRQKELEAQRTSITKPLNDVTKAVNALFAGPTQLLDQAETILKAKMIAFQDEQQRIALEARRKAEAEAEAERRRLEAEAADRARFAAEQAALAQTAAAEGDTQTATLAQAASVRAAAEAQTAVDTAQMVVAPTALVVAPPKASGISTAKKVDFEITDLAKLVAFIAHGDGERPLARPDLLGLVVADSVKVRAMVKALGAQANLPGVRVFEGKVMSARAA